MRHILRVCTGTISSTGNHIQHLLCANRTTKKSRPRALRTRYQELKKRLFNNASDALTLSYRTSHSIMFM